MADPNAPDDCPLSVADQTRNVMIVAANTALSYLAAPVTYVDSFHTALIHDLQKQAGRQPWATLSNVPYTAYMVFTILPLIVAWAYPQIRLLRRIVLLCYATMAIGCAVMAVALVLPLPWWLKVAVVIAHGAMMGGARTVGVAIEFEVLGVAVSQRLRGKALGRAYGYGPVLAVAGNLLAQLLVKGQVWHFAPGARPFPENFAAIFAFGAPVLGLAAFLCSRLVVPLPAHDNARQPFLTGVFGGLGQFLRRRTTLLAFVSAVLLFWGYSIIGNMTLFTGLVLGGEPSDTAGYQKAILYTFKVVMGLTMGWLLARSAPRSAVLISSMLGLSAVIFAMVAPPAIFLLSFGLLGAGQLYGIYITNYVLCAAPKHLMRRYMAFMMLTGLPTAPASTVLGAISDFVAEMYKNEFPIRLSLGAAVGPGGAEHFAWRFGNSYGYPASFAFAAAVMALGITLSLFMPPRPTTGEETATRGAADVDTQSTVS